MSASLSGNGDKVIPSLCHGCGSYKPFCGVLCHVKDGRFVRVEGNPGAFNNGVPGSTAICAKGLTGPQYVYAADRLEYPLKRIGAKGEGKFQRITWDEALDTIADKLTETKEKYGPEAYGVLSPEYWPVLSTLGRRFLNVYGSPNYMHSAICATPRMAAAKVTVGYITMEPDDWQKTKLYVNWGANVENSGVNKGTVRAILNALASGTKYIDIRPMLDPLGAKADMWLPVRPGTDCALALAILNVLIGENLYDAAFVAEWCHSFDKLAEYVRQFPPEWAEPITGLPAEQIREAARLIGTTRPAFIKMGNGIGDQTNDGTSTTSAISLIAAITGNLDVPGGHFAPPPGGGPGPAIPLLEELAPPDMVERLVAPESPIWYQKKGWVESGPTTAYYKGLMSILSGKPYPLRVLNASCSNPLSATRNPKKVAEALKKLDFMFVMDISHAPHVDFADIVLPACTSYEQGDFFCTRNTREGVWVGGYNKVVEPLGESRSDWRFYLDLAVRMGYGEHFWQGSMDGFMNEMLARYGVTAEQLRQNPGGILVAKPGPPSGAPEYRKYSTLFKDLPHGKVQCCNELIGGQEGCDQSGTLPYFPVYKGPPEGLAETPELAKEFPLILSDVHAYCLAQHSYFHNVAYLRELQPYPWLRIDPTTAETYGIADGDWVKVESPHGWCRLKAECFSGISPEVLMTKRGWWQTCEELDLPGYGTGDGGSEVNNLYSSDESLFDKFFSQMAKQTLVKISKWEEAWNSIQNGDTPTGCDGRVRGKDAGSARSRATGATEDDASCRPVQTRRPRLHLESSCQAMTDGYAFSHDPNRCVKCYSCETACKQWKAIAPGTVKLRRVYEVATGTFPLVALTFHSVACQHCPDPPCIAACRPGAISKNAPEGIVLVDAEKCDGCRACLDACPFEAPQFDQDGVMRLCDLCADRLVEGQGPICSDACPTGALRYKTNADA